MYQCQLCLSEGRESFYYGESGRNMYTRQLEHRKDMRNMNESNAMVKHAIIQHDGVMPDWKLKVTSSYSSPMYRQNNEGVRIALSKADMILNSRMEFRQAPLIRAVSTRGLDNEQERNGQGVFSQRGGGDGEGGGARGGEQPTG